MTEASVRLFLDAYPYADEVKETILGAFRTLSTCEEFSAVLAVYEEDPYVRFDDLLARISELAKSLDIHAYLAHLVFMIACTPRLRRLYLDEGVSLDILRDTLADLYYKTLECIAVEGRVGSFVAQWESLIFRFRLFAFGRLQFEPKELADDTVVGDTILPAGTTVLSVHIPRTLTPLHHDAVQDSYRAADIFFRSRGVCEHTVFTCSSWLLFPRHREMLKPTSNILAFAADYTLTASGENEGYHDLWRLFDCRCTNPDEMPADTSVRRAYIDLVRRGERTGWGRGFILYS